ncbi:MAG: hypothetical protein HQM16_05600 [Deltaproteobacteria bacterium]|nr:hypothetical protein [Deltaproteobacteria bacterium]
MSEELEVLKTVSQKLNNANIPYMVSGSVAMNFHAQPRMTRDIDIVINLSQTNIQNFIDIFKEDFYLDEDTIKKEVSASGMFNLIHNKYIIKVDFIIHKNDEFSLTAFERRLNVDVDGVIISIATAEDLILVKLDWAKESISEMQLKDVSNIKKMAEHINYTYLNNWIDKLGLQEVYKKIT